MYNNYNFISVFFRIPIYLANCYPLSRSAVTHILTNNQPNSLPTLNFPGHLSENIGSLCLSAEYSDVTLVVEGVRIPAHKVILAASSDYFRALLYGGMREASQVRL